MKVLIAPDKFKGSLTASEVCQLTMEAILDGKPGWQVECVPMADGGEGTMETLTSISQGHLIDVIVRDPLSRNIKASYGLSSDSVTAFIEMAKASGLQLLQPDEREVGITSTFGTGQLIKDALNRGAQHIILGIGGSATNDAGTGMAEALGFQFENAGGFALNGIGNNLIKINKIVSENADQRLGKTRFTVLCDVSNPLHGKEGAAYVFAGQKGADENTIEMLDKGLKNFEKVAGSFNERSINFPGAGAAGGLGAGCALFLDAHFESGIEFVINFTGLREKLKEADLVITGEGKIDKQTLSGKVVNGVSELVRDHKKRLVLLCGVCDLTEALLTKLGHEQLISLVDENTNSQMAIENAAAILQLRIKSKFKNYP